SVDPNWRITLAMERSLRMSNSTIIPPGSENRSCVRGSELSRRSFLHSASVAASGAAALGASSLAGVARAAEPASDRAQIAITLDLEMARNFPTWEDTHWDYEKGNLNPEAKRYAVEAARRVKAHGGVIHFFAVGQVFE